jgi:hypothetical protein
MTGDPYDDVFGHTDRATDTELRTLFAGEPRRSVDLASTRNLVGRRSRQLRTQRRLAAGTGALSSLVLLGFAFTAMHRSSGRVITRSPDITVITTSASSSRPAIATTLSPEPTPTTSAPTVPSVEATPPTSILEPTDSAAEATETEPCSTSTCSPTARPTSTTIGARGSATSLQGPSTSTVSSTPTTARPASSAPATTVVATSTTRALAEQTFSVSGGSVRVRSTSSTMTLVSTTPTSGWSVVDSHVEPKEIEITFGRGSTRSVVKLNLEDGKVRQRRDD